MRRWWYDWSNSAVSSIIISGFLPLLVQDCAQRAAGFPGVCPNLIAMNATALVATFGADGAEGVTSAYYLPEADPDFLPSSACVAAGAGSLCPGAPGSADQCLFPLSGAVYPLRVTAAGGGEWDPAAYTNAMNSVSTGLQMLVFIALSGLADYGPFRKRMLMGLSLAGCAFAVLCLSIREASWQWGGALIVLTSVCCA